MHIQTLKKENCNNFDSKNLCWGHHHFFFPLQNVCMKKNKAEPMKGSAVLENFLVKQISHQTQWDVVMWFAVGQTKRDSAGES